jgi:hypothetical protein
VRGLDESGQFIGWNHGDPLFALADNDYDFVVVGNAIQDGGQALAEVGVGGLGHISPLVIVQEPCT